MVLKDPFQCHGRHLRLADFDRDGTMDISFVTSGGANEGIHVLSGGGARAFQRT
jgi:hypothetical protein